MSVKPTSSSVRRIDVTERNTVDRNVATLETAPTPALSYVAASASQPVLEHTLGDALRLAARTWPSKSALIEGAVEASEWARTFRPGLH